ncbi:DUF1571 domain-containing protein [Burkholderia gladioli]|uniref:DUF1571 domain-containing protein n=1 Tax=Burkholderia gladioli TaxID=28095 RepID=UPI00163ECE32|nr:DUF1571 domain-containing protein [Burkholderia gladioli]
MSLPAFLRIAAWLAIAACMSPPLAHGEAASEVSSAAASETAAPAGQPDVSPAQVGALPLDRQVRWLRRAAETGALEKLDDAALLALFQSLDASTVPRYIEQGPNAYASYEFTMRRQERIHGTWPSRPDHMLVRLSSKPLRIYAKWLPDGAHAGQEIIYDESRRRDQLYGHLGGLLNVLPVWASLNGALAHTQSRHPVRDIGTAFIAGQFLTEGAKLGEAGGQHPARIEVKTIDGVRVVAFTYETPTGQPEYYAKKETLGLDLRHPWFRTAESYDNDGRLFEQVVFETITPRDFDDSAFDPANPAYRFH